jgi:hypothetical protein
MERSWFRSRLSLELNRTKETKCSCFPSYGVQEGSREAPPIKRPFAKENTAPGEETIIVSLLRYGGVAYILRLCLCVSQVVFGGSASDKCLIHNESIMKR